MTKNEVERPIGATDGPAMETGRVIPEVFFADIAVDAPGIATLFNEPSAIEHLAGIAPANYPRNLDVRRYGRKVNADVVVANPEEIYDYYNNPNLIVLKTVDENGQVDGTAAVVRSPGIGIVATDALKVVVAERARHKGKGYALFAAATAIAVSQKGLGMDKVNAAAILGIAGSRAPRDIMEAIGYEGKGELPLNCISWSNEKQLFERRNVAFYTYTANNRQAVRELEKFLPKDMSRLRK